MMAITLIRLDDRSRKQGRMLTYKCWKKIKVREKEKRDRRTCNEKI
jgi:hypothetical protein